MSPPEGATDWNDPVPHGLSSRWAHAGEYPGHLTGKMRQHIHNTSLSILQLHMSKQLSRVRPQGIRDTGGYHSRSQ